MSVIRIASRYAKSLLDLSEEQNVLYEVVADMNGFTKMVENRDLYLLLKSPIINIDKKKDVFNALFDGKVNKLTKAFFDIILKKGREMYLPEIAKEFLNQYKERQGISEVTLTTATKISDEALDKIKSKLLGSDVTAKTLEIDTKVDESIIGGFIVQVGDKLIDASVAHKLRELSKSMTNKEYEKAF